MNSGRLQTTMRAGGVMLIAAVAMLAAATDALAQQTGQTIRESGELRRGDDQLPNDEYVDAYEFEAEQGARVTIVLESDDFDAYLLLLGPDGEVVAENDDHAGTNSRIRMTLEDDGEYQVLVTSYGAEETGDYDLEIVIGDGGRGRDRGRAIRESGELRRGDDQLPGEEYVDVYEFEADQGARVTIELESDDFDAYLLLMDPDGEVVAEDDDGWQGTNSRIVATLEDEGEYQVLVTSYGAEETGDYDLTIEIEGVDEDDDRGRDEQTITESGELERGDDQLPNDEYVDSYEIDLAEDARVTISVESDDFDTYLLLLDPEGEVVEENDDHSGTNSRIRTEVDEAGQYTVLVTSYGAEETGEYELEITIEDGRTGRPDHEPLQIVDRGELEDGGEQLPEGEYFDAYEIETEGGLRVEVSVESDDFDTYLMLIDPDGDVVLEDDDGGSGTNSRLAATLEEEGTYKVLVTSYGAEETGDYVLTITMPDVPAAGGDDDDAHDDADDDDEDDDADDDDDGAALDVRGELEDGDETHQARYADSYEIEVEQGQLIHAVMESDDFDARVLLMDPRGKQVMGDPEYSSESVITASAARDGTYTIMATSVERDATGDYSLTVHVVERDDD